MQCNCSWQLQIKDLDLTGRWMQPREHAQPVKTLDLLRP